MLHFLVTHVRGNRGKTSSESMPRGEAANPPSTAVNIPPNKSPKQLEADEITGSIPGSQPRLWPVSDRTTESCETKDVIRANQHSSTTVLSILLLLPVCGLSGCACLHRDKVDANVVSARQLSLRGIDAMQRDKWDDAEALFGDALQKNPADERAHRHFAELLWRRGQHQVAIRHQEESVRLSGGDPALLVELGEMYLQQGNADAALDCADEAIDANSHLSGAWALRGDIHRRREEPSKALECYHRALNYQPHYPHVQLALAELYQQSEQPRRALSTLESLAGQFPPERVPQEVEFQRGMALKSLGRYQDAVEAMTVAAQRAEPSPDLLCQLGEAQFLAGNAASARLAVQAALARNPQHSGSLKMKDKLDRQSQVLSVAVDRK
jgi:tetratricopeptide (TPR) repeat protein